MNKKKNMLSINCSLNNAIFFLERIETGDLNRDYGKYIRCYKKAGRGRNFQSDEDIPKIFWKYYDLYRRKIITIDEYVGQTGLSGDMLRKYLALSNL